MEMGVSSKGRLVFCIEIIKWHRGINAFVFMRKNKRVTIIDEVTHEHKTMASQLLLLSINLAIFSQVYAYGNWK